MSNTPAKTTFDYSRLPPEDAEKLRVLAKKIRALSGSRRRRFHRGDGDIYFVQQGDEGPIKIGYTKRLIPRINELQIANPYELNLILCFRGFAETERELHAKFRKDRMLGEWFEASDDIMEFVKEKREWLEN